MSKIIEALGALAPFAGIALLFVYRSRSPRPAALGILGAGLAGLGSIAGLLGDRVALFGSSDELLERLEGWALVRLVLLVTGTAILVIAAAAGTSRGRAHRWSLIAAALLFTVAGTALRFVHIDLGDDHHGLQLLVTMAIEMLQFGLLGIGILVLCIAVVSRRVDDGRPEPLRLARAAAQRAWQAYQRSGRRG
jgi:cytochrome bd-type quinol oxidase subunit 2